jgi:hypothetical protein
VRGVSTATQPFSLDALANAVPLNIDLSDADDR